MLRIGKVAYRSSQDRLRDWARRSLGGIHSDLSILRWARSRQPTKNELPHGCWRSRDDSPVSGRVLRFIWLEPMELGIGRFPSIFGIARVAHRLSANRVGDWARSSLGVTQLDFFLRPARAREKSSKRITTSLLALEGCSFQVVCYRIFGCIGICRFPSMLRIANVASRLYGIRVGNWPRSKLGVTQSIYLEVGAFPAINPQREIYNLAVGPRWVLFPVSGCVLPCTWLKNVYGVGDRCVVLVVVHVNIRATTLTAKRKQDTSIAA
ncbi:unnamed protein product, partial [Ectocarpus sp. 13 AM-2016]